jgi:hypothetical protein
MVVKVSADPGNMLIDNECNQEILSISDPN